MPAKIATNFLYQGLAHLDGRKDMATTREELMNWDVPVPEGYTIVVDGVNFVYSKDINIPETGHWYPEISEQSSIPALREKTTFSQSYILEKNEEITNEFSSVRDEMRLSKQAIDETFDEVKSTLYPITLKITSPHTLYEWERNYKWILVEWVATDGKTGEEVFLENKRLTVNGEDHIFSVHDVNSTQIELPRAGVYEIVVVGTINDEYYTADITIELYPPMRMGFFPSEPNTPNITKVLEKDISGEYELTNDSADNYLWIGVGDITGNSVDEVISEGIRIPMVEVSDPDNFLGPTTWKRSASKINPGTIKFNIYGK